MGFHRYKLLGGKDCLFYAIKRGEKRLEMYFLGAGETIEKRIFNLPLRMALRRSAACAISPALEIYENYRLTD
jgi:hypothetical protein